MIINQQVGISLLSPLRTLSISYPNFTENYNAAGYSTLPTTNPGSAGAQVSYTVQSTDVPTITGQVSSSILTGAILTGCQNTSASSMTIYCYAYKNGTTVANTSATVAANNYVTFHCRFSPLSVGDLLTIAMYASATGANFQYWTTVITQQSNVVLETPSTIFMPIIQQGQSYSYTTNNVAPTQGPSPKFASNGTSMFATYSVNLTLLSRPLQSVYTQNSNGLFTAATDGNDVKANVNATYMPYYNQYERVASFTYRIVNTKA